MGTENEYFYTRNIDNLGRLVIPKNFREKLGIVANKTSLKISLDGDKIVISVLAPSCFICGETENIINLKNKYVCENCLEKLNEIKKLSE